jgi:predicted MFS family arabinose efflux permease
MLPITGAIAVRVPQRTATALGIVAVGSSAGALVMAPLLQVAIDAVGWRDAYWGMAAIVLLTPIPCLLFALPRGPLHRIGAIRPRLDLVRELRRPGVPALCGVMVLPGLVSFGVNVHLVPLLTDAGHSAGLAAGVLGLTVGASALGKLVGGNLGDRIGAIATLRLALACELVGVALLMLAGSKPVIGLFVVAQGFAIGGQIAVMPVIALTIFGSERFGTLYGLLSLASALAIGLAPVIPGFMREAAGSYTGTIVFWSVAMVLSIAVAFMLRATPATVQASDHA